MQPTSPKYAVDYLDSVANEVELFTNQTESEELLDVAPIEAIMQCIADILAPDYKEFLKFVKYGSCSCILTARRKKDYIRDLIAFFLFGLINNFGYVVMLR